MKSFSGTTPKKGLVMQSQISPQNTHTNQCVPFFLFFLMFEGVQLSNVAKMAMINRKI
jgi:hypothetical protein